MTLDDLNLPEPELPEVPAAGAEEPEATVEATPVVTLDALEEEPAPEPTPEPEPVFHQQPQQPVYHSTPTQPVYHNTQAQPVYHNSPVRPVHSAQILEPTSAPEKPAAPIKHEKPAKHHKHHRKPPIGLRVVMQFGSFLLAIALFAVVIGGVLIADLRELTSEGGIKKIVNALLMPVEKAPVSIHPAPIHAAPLSNKLDEPAAPGTQPTEPGDVTVDENGNVIIGGDTSVNLGDIPDDILTGGGGDGNVLNLVDWFYDQIDASTDKPLKYSREEMREFVQESTVSDYLSEKLAGYTADFINGTEETQIDTREVMDLLKENEDLMQSKLNMELNDQQWVQIENTVVKIVEEDDLNTTIRDKVYTAVDNVLEENSALLGGIDREDIQETLQFLTSDGLFFGILGGGLLLLALLILLNYYNPPAGLTWAAISVLMAGLILALPIVLLTTATELVISMIPGIAGVVGLLASFVDVFAPVHYTAVGIGAALLVASILWRILRAVFRKRRALV